MTLLDRFRGGTVAGMTDSNDSALVEAELHAEREHNALLQESLADLERDNRGWLRLDGIGIDQEFSRQGLSEIAAAARLNWIANPLIQRAVNVRTHYTWGQGVEIAGRDDDVNQVVQAFLDDTLNQQVLFEQQAQEEKDRSLQLDGNLLFALFTSPLTGRVQLRVLPFGEVTDIITDPGDREQRWFYVREWNELTIDPISGRTEQKSYRALYPDLSYRPLVRPKMIGSTPVNWDSPVLHMRAGGLDGMRFGVSEVYSALAWARAYRGFLEDWASLAKSLSKFAWKGKAPRSKVTAMRQGLENRPGTLPSGSALPAGQALVSDGQVDLTPISKTGATLDADSGRPLAMMVAAAMDIPYTILMGDADVGNLATAKTLDRPTELAMESRREMWAAALRRMFAYVIDQAVKAPQGPLRGTIKRDEFQREVITLADDADRNVDITFPSILEHDQKALVDAIVLAAGTEKVPGEIIARLLLTALGVEDVDEVMAELVDDDGKFIDPGLAAAASAGQSAVDAFRRGEDPADLLR